MSNQTLDQRIIQDVDYIVLVNKEKKHRLENEISLGATACVDIVSNLNFLIFL